MRNIFSVEHRKECGQTLVNRELRNFYANELVEFQRGNAALVLGTLPTIDFFDNVFYCYIFKELRAN